MNIVRKEIITVGGLQEQFMGLEIGKFLLVPDSDTGTRPDNLRVTGPNALVLNIHGGMSLRVEDHDQGTSLNECLEKLTKIDRAVLRTMAWNLPGRTWPAAAESLKQIWERWGEEKILFALEHLFAEVVKAEKAKHGIGRRIKMIFHPATAR